MGFADKLRLMTVLMEDLRTVKELGIKGCRECCFSTGGQYFAAVNGTTISIYNTYTCENVGNLRGHNGKVRLLKCVHTRAARAPHFAPSAFARAAAPAPPAHAPSSPRAARGAAASARHAPRCVCTTRPPASPAAQVRALFWSPDDTRLISAGMDGAVYEWRLKDFKRDKENVLKGCNYSSVLATSDCKTLYAAGERGGRSSGARHGNGRARLRGPQGQERC